MLRGRRVLTLVPGLEGDALWWENGRIRGVGRAAAIERRAPRHLPRLDHPDALVTPGFVDGHTHFAMWALGRRRVQLAGATTRAEALVRVAAGAPSRGWILGHGWDANSWSERPDRYALDRVHANPVYLDSLDVHAAWVNSASLAVARVIPPPSDESLDEALRDAQAEAHRLGVTGLHDVEDQRAWAGFRRLEDAGDLRLRVLFHPPVASLPDLVRRGQRSGAGSPWLGMGGVTLFLDGSLGSRTAWMLEPYEGSRDRGMPVAGEQAAAEAMRLAAAHGIAVTAHAIGDAAVRQALDLLERLSRAAVPHRIEHFQCVHSDDLARAARAGIVVSMQPAHLLTDIPLVDRHWGRRGRGAYVFRSLLQRGTAVVFGSDVPVASVDPREGVYAAMERRAADGTPREGWRLEERLGFEEVVRAYTLEAARASGTERRLGRLAPGMEADLVAWDVDPAVERGDGAAFRAGRAALTVVGGRIVMHR